jgi:transposase
MFALQPEMKVFSGSANRELADRICNYIGVPLGKATISSFPDGETYVRIEENVRGKDPATRVKARQEKSAAIVASLFELWETELPRLSGKSKLAEAIRYALSRRAALERFLSDGRVEIDSNIVERAIRPQTITRKNALFAGSAGGGRTWATVATLLQTAKMNDVDPHTWLTQALERIAQGWPISNIVQLMPWNFKA